MATNGAIHFSNGRPINRLLEVVRVHAKERAKIFDGQVRKTCMGSDGEKETRGREGNRKSERGAG
jgi:hypothetical protein